MGFGRSSSGRLTRVVALVTVGMLISSFAVWTASQPASGASLPPGFQEQTVFSGLKAPTAVRLRPEAGCSSPRRAAWSRSSTAWDPTPDVFADLRTKVHNYWDHGLLGLALPPTSRRTLCLRAVHHDAPIGGTAPRWGTPAPPRTIAPPRPARLTTGAS